MFILGSPRRQEETFAWQWAVKLKQALEIKTNKRLNIIPALIMCLITAVDNITRRKQCFTKLKRSEGYNLLMLGRRCTYFSKAFHSNWDEPHNRIKVNKSPATACCLWHVAVLVRDKRCIQKSFLSVIEDTWCEWMRANFADVCVLFQFVCSSLFGEPTELNMIIPASCMLQKGKIAITFRIAEEHLVFSSFISLWIIHI